MARKIYYVSPDSGRWKITHNGTNLSYHTTKEAAEKAGVEVAKANQPSQLVIQRADGTFEQEFTYGNDPFPPRG